MVTDCKGWKEAALERIYVYNGEIYTCMYASANRIWLPPGAFKGTPGSGWFKVRFRVSRAFFPADAPPFLRPTTRLSKGDLVCDKCERDWLRNPLSGGRGDNVDPSNGETLPVSLPARNYAPDQRWGYAWFLRAVGAEYIWRDAYRSVRGISFMHKTFMRLKKCKFVDIKIAVEQL